MNQIASLLLKELDTEMPATRAMLERVPNDQYNWQPHPKSMTLQQLVSHITDIPGWPSIVLTTSEIDFAADNDLSAVPVNDTPQALVTLERQYEAGRNQLEKADDEQLLNETWTMRAGSHEIDTLSKYMAIRMSLNQLTHHRAQLGVYLRLLNIPIPGSYGPSADEMEAMFGAKSEHA